MAGAEDVGWEGERDAKGLRLEKIHLVQTFRVGHSVGRVVKIVGSLGCPWLEMGY